VLSYELALRAIAAMLAELAPRRGVEGGSPP
jgi:hypothetical protein